MIDGRILAAGVDLGSGFCLTDKTVVTAAHVVDKRRAADLEFVISGTAVSVDELRIDRSIDVAILRVTASLAVVPRLSHYGLLAQWQVTARPGRNAPLLTGVITAEREVINIHNHEVSMLQLHVNEDLAQFAGYSGSAVLIGDSVVAVLVEQVQERLPRAAGPVKATNVLYAVPLKLVIERFNLNHALRPYHDDPRPAGQLLDAAFFDLDPMKKAILDAMSASDSQRLAIGIECSESVLIRKLCDWLPVYLGEVQLRDRLNLRPEFTSIEAAVRSVRRYLPDLARTNVSEIGLHLITTVHADWARSSTDPILSQLGLLRTPYLVMSTAPNLPGPASFPFVGERMPPGQGQLTQQGRARLVQLADLPSA